MKTRTQGNNLVLWTGHMRMVDTLENRLNLDGREYPAKLIASFRYSEGGSWPVLV